MQPQTIHFAPYETQRVAWPTQGRSILAQFDEQKVVVYQAYCPEIADFVVNHGHFLGGVFSLTRMSWIKPGFLWMMFRSGWATKPNQERILAIALQRFAFDKILSEAVESKFVSQVYCSEQAWKDAIKASNVRLQWDPDHGPSGEPLSRRVIQLGLRAEVLARYAKEWIISVEDITAFVHSQVPHVLSGNISSLITPVEMVYPVSDKTARVLGVDDGSYPGADTIANTLVR